MENSLLQNVYNPDVLSCIANLSSDEVFTPPALANKMIDMLPQELFENPDNSQTADKRFKTSNSRFGETCGAHLFQTAFWRGNNRIDELALTPQCIL